MFMEKYRKQASLYIIISIILLISIGFYQGYQSINNKINLLEERVKELELIAFNKQLFTNFVDKNVELPS